MNEHLKFSWAHILFFVAIIVISYFNYLGLSFASGGDVVYSVVVTVLISVVFFAIFFILQQVKGAERDFPKWHKIEILLWFMGIISSVVCMHPAWHFSNLLEKESDLKANHEQTVKNIASVFSNYEDYANNRIKNFNKKVDHMELYPYQKENHKEVIALMLMSDNFHALKDSYTSWADSSGVEELSLWNIAQVDNINRIESYFKEYWYGPLQKMSERNMQLEVNVQKFDENGEFLKEILDQSQKTKNICKNGYLATPSILGILFSLIALLLMFLPYWQQSREPRNPHGRRFVPFGTRTVDITIGKDADEGDDSIEKEMFYGGGVNF